MDFQPGNRDGTLNDRKGRARGLSDSPASRRIK